MKILLVMAIFFSSSVAFCMNSTESRQELVDLLSEEQCDAITLHAIMSEVWTHGFINSDDGAKKAYMAFLDIADGHYPLISTPVANKMVLFGMAQRMEDGQALVEPYKIDLWNNRFQLGDGMKPMIRDTQDRLPEENQ